MLSRGLYLVDGRYDNGSQIGTASATRAGEVLTFSLNLRAKTLTMTFENAFDLKDSISSPEFQKLPDAADDLLGKFKAEIQERKLTFHRQIDLTKTIPGSVFIPNEQLKDHKLVTIIHLPKAASSHNAHSIENSGKTLIWSTPIATAFRDPLSQSFIMPLPIPWIKIGSTALAVIVLIGAIFYYIHSKNKSKRI